jgi:hypothetical protein
MFKVDIQKRLSDEFWTNRYFIRRDTLSEAVTSANFIVEAERIFHATTVLFDRVRVSDMVPGTDEYVTSVLNSAGFQNDDGELLPLFNVLRMDLSATSGRPSRKYYRGVLRETHITFNDVSNGIRNTAEDAIADLLAIPLVDIDDQDLVGATSFSKVGMRQLRRGSKRRTTPIIP